MKKTIKITYLKKATKFFKKNSSLLDEKSIDELIVKFVKYKFFDIATSIDFKELKGNLKGFYRIRKGNVRIIFKIVDSEIIIEAIVNDIDFRGNIYDK